MRSVTKINNDWIFIKDNVGVVAATSAPGVEINIPHTWNNKDGQDGGNDYYRGTCWYVKKLEQQNIRPGDQVYLEFRGVAMSADVYLNETLLFHHDGGYSTFRVNITEHLREFNTLAVAVDNSPSRKVYPQKADFTFYGGIYRDVYLITVPDSHFDLDYYGAPGIMVTPKINGKDAQVVVQAFVTGNKGDVRITIEGLKAVTAHIKDGIAKAKFEIKDVHLWNGLKDPYLYTAKAELVVDGAILDEISTRFGCRTFSFDQEQGFFLNGHSYPLRGVCRHQDRMGVGNALTPKMHKEDFELIREMGANTIRLAHYQHDQYFYDLCDEAGMIVWAEIPYITEHMPEGRDNTISQLTELIAQNYNHPSIICWGLSNEITFSGGLSEDCLDNHRVLNTLAHKMDSTRPTTIANVGFVEYDSPLLEIPDLFSYNLYFGWYNGEAEQINGWFNDFHRIRPDKFVGLSEYGADAVLRWQTGYPKKGDYTEQYQAVFHEHYLKAIMKRPYIWATHVWNMFDFAADARNEGGANGLNHKGLVTFDRMIKKDAFFLYQAYLSELPFVHVCGSRYLDRTENITEIKVYTNQKTVAIYDNGKLIEEKEGDKIFRFTLPLTGEHTIEARSGSLSDTIKIRKVAKPNTDYILPEELISNWFK